MQQNDPAGLGFSSFLSNFGNQVAKQSDMQGKMAFEKYKSDLALKKQTEEDKARLDRQNKKSFAPKVSLDPNHIFMQQHDAARKEFNILANKFLNPDILKDREIYNYVKNMDQPTRLKAAQTAYLHSNPQGHSILFDPANVQKFSKISGIMANQNQQPSPTTPAPGMASENPGVGQPQPPPQEDSNPNF